MAAAEVVTTVGQPAVMIAVLVVVAALGARRARSWQPALVGAGALVVLGLLDNGVKAVVARPRPPVAWQAVAAHGMSFPSGHALWSAGALLLVVVLVGPIRGRIPLALVAFLVAVGVAGSRLVLAVRYPSDVLRRMGPGRAGRRDRAAHGRGYRPPRGPGRASVIGLLPASDPISSRRYSSRRESDTVSHRFAIPSILPPAGAPPSSPTAWRRLRRAISIGISGSRRRSRS